VERILAAADAEIGAHGLARTSTRRIAERAGVSVGAMYRFFADKEAVAVALAERYLAEAERAYAPVLESVTAPTEVAGAISGLVTAAAELQARFPGYYRLSEERLPGEAGSPTHVAREALVRLFADALVRVEPARDPVRTALAVDLAVETVRHALAHAPAVPADRAALVAELAAMLTAYLTAPA